MQRRDFITILGGAAAWPITARGQQRERMRRIGVLMGVSESDAERQMLVKVFRDALTALGWAVGRNIIFDYRWSGASNDLAKSFARELVALAPDLLFTQSVELVTALRNETRTIPILFGSASDPVDVRLVDNIARPGGNITGFMSVQAATNVKYLEIIKGLDPRVMRALVLMSSRDPSNEGRSRAILAGGPSLGISVSRADVFTETDIERAIDVFAQQPGGAIIIVGSPVTTNYRKTILTKASDYRVPTIGSIREIVSAGALAAYAPDIADQYRRAASYADRILKGEKPGDLPIQAPIKFELIINLKTAKSIALEIPPAMLAIADEVIE